MRISLVAIISITTIFVQHGRAGPLREASNSNSNLVKKALSSFLVVGSTGRKPKGAGNAGGPKKLRPGIEFKIFAQ